MLVDPTHFGASNLTTLKLQGILGSDVNLKELLLAHAGTLRPLDLSQMDLALGCDVSISSRLSESQGNALSGNFHQSIGRFSNIFH